MAMPNEERAWDLNRLPTKAERVIGTSLATLIFLLTSGLLLRVTYRLYLAGKVDGNSAWPFAFSIIMFMAAAVLLWRIAFTKPSKPTVGAITVTGYVFLASGVAILVLCAIYGTKSPRAVGAGIAAVVGGAALAKKGKRARER